MNSFPLVYEFTRITRMGTCFSSPSSPSSDDLLARTLENTKKWTLAGRTTDVKVVRVVDGDTVDVAFYLNPLDGFVQFRVRLYGIDTPEKRPPKAQPNRDAEIAAAKRSSEALTNRLAEKTFLAHATFREADKYGRWLCDLRLTSTDEQTLNGWMIAEGYAKPYFGGTKEEFAD